MAAPLAPGAVPGETGTGAPSPSAPVVMASLAAAASCARRSASRSFTRSSARRDPGSEMPRARPAASSSRAPSRPPLYRKPRKLMLPAAQDPPAGGPSETPNRRISGGLVQPRRRYRPPHSGNPNQYLAQITSKMVITSKIYEVSMGRMVNNGTKEDPGNACPRRLPNQSGNR